ncbi:glycogen/starch synthase [Cupriavidus necator]|uniref:glycogen/starch synthase n=1 Tax=Cupriavidus necator TaxID=106590 RepID=UPI0039C27984
MAGWLADTVHAHDWHAGLVPLLLRLGGQRRPRTIFTVHNAAFQGNFPLDWAAKLGLPHAVATADGVEFYGV